MKYIFKKIFTIIISVVLLNPATPCFADNGVAGTFLQPTGLVKNWDEDTWETVFETYEQLGIKEVIVQWLVYSEFYLDRAGEGGKYDPSVIKKALYYAEKYNMKITLGCMFLDSYWERIKSQPDLIKVHLKRIRYGTSLAMQELAPLLNKSSAFAGWYIAQEIDDRTWLGESQKALLCSFISNIYDELNSFVAGKPISISAFSNGWASPETLGLFWKDVAQRSGLDRVLFQDGVGVEKLTIDEAVLYLQNIQNKLKDTTCIVQPVVEIFEKLDGPEFKAVPASAKRIKRQLAAELPYAPDGVILFSVAEYMSPLGGPEAEHLLRKMLDTDG
ncbi:DUF4434 domain-containing protein [Maridesulfovibrio hydrothermalis]|uniref:DUF4434 domain-containing protein n=1 Tax=Maridesulfovibrio hydrothermalis AM13 = DSM 14728 TaxID=1121451 RepID=L0RE03_9BACT|nr:DUF4434 domain-containing protein [Maridesulfovibrio hydrothermalis]CCO25023.1 conserved exported protein of unknown function [Maridesulfovibrio hydrothermalis AM13 = DSM 14728]